jgi:glyoxylase-like metal-dependent hydrolase (beta-lactamase superfamily II)
VRAGGGRTLRVADRWFERREVEDGLLLVTEPHVDPFLRANVWLVRGRNRDVLVDSGLGLASLRQALADLLDRPLTAVATHRHYDHVGGLHEFDEVVVHRADAAAVAAADGFASLLLRDYPAEELVATQEAGIALPEVLIDALPHEGYDPAAYRVHPAVPTRVVDEGDVVSTGDRELEVLHLPGHTPGSIGLWEAETRTLFSGDCIYSSGQLLDELPESNVADYVQSVCRLRDLPVRAVHGGHDPSFGRGRLLELVDEYLARRG